MHERVAETGTTGPVSGNNVPISNAADSTSVSFSTTYHDPVVVGHIATNNGGQPVDTRVANISPSGFDLFSHEPDNGGHSDNNHSYIVCEQGAWETHDGTAIEAGKHTTETHFYQGETPKWDTVEFNTEWSQPPAVIANVNTHSNGTFSTPAIRNVTATSFQVAQQVRNSNEIEEIGWIAVEPGVGDIDGNNYEAGSESVSSATWSASFNQKPDYVADLNSFSGSDQHWLRGDTTWSATGAGWFSESGSASGDRGYIAIEHNSLIYAEPSQSNDTGTLLYQSPSGTASGGGYAGSLSDSGGDYSGSLDQYSTVEEHPEQTFVDTVQQQASVGTTSTSAAADASLSGFGVESKESTAVDVTTTVTPLSATDTGFGISNATASIVVNDGALASPKRSNDTAEAIGNAATAAASTDTRGATLNTKTTSASITEKATTATTGGGATVTTATGNTPSAICNGETSAVFTTLTVGAEAQSTNTGPTSGNGALVVTLGGEKQPTSASTGIGSVLSTTRSVHNILSGAVDTLSGAVSTNTQATGRRTDLESAITTSAENTTTSGSSVTASAETTPSGVGVSDTTAGAGIQFAETSVPTSQPTAGATGSAAVESSSLTEQQATVKSVTTSLVSKSTRSLDGVLANVESVTVAPVEKAEASPVAQKATATTVTGSTGGREVAGYVPTDSTPSALSTSLSGREAASVSPQGADTLPTSTSVSQSPVVDSSTESAVVVDPVATAVGFDATASSNTTVGPITAQATGDINVRDGVLVGGQRADSVANTTAVGSVTSTGISSEPAVAQAQASGGNKDATIGSDTFVESVTASSETDALSKESISATPQAVSPFADSLSGGETISARVETREAVLLVLAAGVGSNTVTSANPTFGPSTSAASAEIVVSDGVLTGPLQATASTKTTPNGVTTQSQATSSGGAATTELDAVGLNSQAVAGGSVAEPTPVTKASVQQRDTVVADSRGATASAGATPISSAAQADTAPDASTAETASASVSSNASGGVDTSIGPSSSLASADLVVRDGALASPKRASVSTDTAASGDKDSAAATALVTGFAGATDGQTTSAASESQLATPVPAAKSQSATETATLSATQAEAETKLTAAASPSAASVPSTTAEPFTAATETASNANIDFDPAVMDSAGVIGTVSKQSADTETSGSAASGTTSASDSADAFVAAESSSVFTISSGGEQETATATVTDAVVLSVTVDSALVETASSTPTLATPLAASVGGKAVSANTTTLAATVAAQAVSASATAHSDVLSFGSGKARTTSSSDIERGVIAPLVAAPGTGTSAPALKSPAQVSGDKTPALTQASSGGVNKTGAKGSVSFSAARTATAAIGLEDAAASQPSVGVGTTGTRSSVEPTSVYGVGLGRLSPLTSSDAESSQATATGSARVADANTTTNGAARGEVTVAATANKSYIASKSAPLQFTISEEEVKDIVEPSTSTAEVSVELSDSES